jgi:hypothetical protein
MASPAKLQKVSDSASRGRSFLPGPGGSGKIPSGTAPATPKPKAAANSGKAGKFPSVSSGGSFPLRSNGKKGSAPSVGSAMSPQSAVKPAPLRSSKAAK